MAFPLPPSFPATSTLHHPSATPTTLLLFLPGNPGLIEFYPHFLRTLSTQLPRTSILGASHAGFTPGGGSTYYPLADQVALKLQLLRWWVSQAGVRDVILVGHSMGCWIAMEMLQALRTDADVNVRGCVMLFPTVIEIAESRAGVMMGPWLQRGLTAEVLGGLCAGLSWLPQKMVDTMIWGATGQPEEAVEATRLLVTNPGLVKQAIRMAGEEMMVIKDDAWDDEVWHGSSQMVFLFGGNDQWVAEKTMRRIEETRGGEGKVKCILDDTGLPHGFCTTRENSESTARIAAAQVLAMLTAGI